MIAVPADSPVTNPEPDAITATAVLLLLQAPDGEPSESVVNAPAQREIILCLLICLI